MACSVDETRPSATYSIPVGNGIKKETETFTYSATDTIRTLHDWIDERMGIPPAQQKVFVHYLRQGRKEIPNGSDQPLTQYLADASKIEVWLKSRNS